MAEHRASVLSASLRRYPDPGRSADPRISALISELRALEIAPLPRSHFRAELRAQLVAVAPRLVAEGPTIEIARVPAAVEPATVRSSPPRFAAVFARVGNLSLGRPAAIVTALIAVFAMVLGGAVYMSKKALPGDALYSLKRANETVQLSLAGGPTAKGKAYLDFANERADEVLALLKRSSALGAGAGPSAADSVSAHTASLVGSTLDSGDADVRDAAQLLGSQAINSNSASSLAIMTQWAPGQISKLQSISAQLPAGSLHDRATASAQLVSSALSRATALTTLAGCSCLRSSPTDDLGPVPCLPCSSPTPAQLPTIPAGILTPGRKSPSTAPNTGAAPAGTASAPSTTLAPPAASGPSSPTGAAPGLTLPTLPIHLPTLPTLTFPTHPPSGATATQSCVISLLGLCIRL